jgi:hypothetical protein
MFIIEEKVENTANLLNMRTYDLSAHGHIHLEKRTGLVRCFRGIPNGAVCSASCRCALRSIRCSHGAGKPGLSEPKWCGRPGITKPKKSKTMDFKSSVCGRGQEKKLAEQSPRWTITVFQAIKSRRQKLMW